ncbi:hypothetical protein BDN72DRAFT_14761 [Pluteus cervinus]|uniref:Uncharacterized protein n=1 Tax=Pluteus cervinus TaxID=181527 RepID=A0ACD3BG59_9AGAR|nr:hypothetical protein BDN72DRAFT_14761 [Pluteus cervinus]
MTTIAIARVYQRSFNTRPNTTLAFTGGSLNALGDVIAQITQNTVGRKPHEEYPGFDAARTLRFFCYGLAISPLLGRWNKYLEHRFPLRVGRGQRKVSIRALSKRVAYDQLLMAPTGLAVFLGSMGLMEAHSIDQIQEKYTDLFIPALIANWKVWPAAQLLNFRFMPLAYRVPFQSACGMFWTLYLSLLNSACVF